MLAPQAMASIRAMVLQNKSAKKNQRRRFIYIDGDVVFHRSESRTPDPIQIKRRIRIERSAYTGDVMREIARRHGVGKSLKQIAIREARRARRSAGDLRPNWMITIPDLSN